MRYLIYTDVHWSTNSSIITSRGEKYSTRLENLIKSVSWAERKAEELKCDAVICLGDFFNKAELNSEEVTALQEVYWANMPHKFIVGNHESPHKELRYNSVNVLQKLNFEIISEVKNEKITNNISFLYLPYLQDDIRETIAQYKEKFNLINPIVLSHNDVAGIQYGPTISKSGIEIDDIENNCLLFLNGHIHNGVKFCKNGYNIGNLTGQNFSEDATKYVHPVYVLDITDEGQVNIQIIVNPYAFNFYEFSITNMQELTQIRNLGENSVVIVKVIKELLPNLKEEIEHNKNIVQSRIILNLTAATNNSDEVTIQSLNDIDHLQRFKGFVVDKLGNSDDVIKEINKIIMN